MEGAGRVGPILVSPGPSHQLHPPTHRPRPVPAGRCASATSHILWEVPHPNTPTAATPTTTTTMGQVCFRDTFPLFSALLSLGIYPVALILVFFLDDIVGWH